MDKVPTGFQRRPDGILEGIPGFYGSRNDPGEAVMGWRAGKRLLVCTEFAPSAGFYSSAMCGKLAKHDPDKNGNPTKCGIHCSAAKRKRAEKSAAEYEAKKMQWEAKSQRQKLTREASEIVREIAAGHNDPRGICLNWVKKWETAQ